MGGERLFRSATQYKGAGERDWSTMKPENLRDIADRLSYHDHTSFRAVCASWRGSSSERAKPLPTMGTTATEDILLRVLAPKIRKKGLTAKEFIEIHRRSDARKLFEDLRDDLRNITFRAMGKSASGLPTPSER